MSRSAVISVVAGLILPVLWTPLESNLFVWLLTASVSPWQLRALQILVGAVSGLLLAAPIAFLVRPSSIRYGLLFCAAFLLSVVASTYLFGGGENLPATLALPDLWAFLLVAFGCFLYAAPRKVRAGAA